MLSIKGRRWCLQTVCLHYLTRSLPVLALSRFLKYLSLSFFFYSPCQYDTFRLNWIISIIKTSIVFGADLVWFKAWSLRSHASSVLIAACLERIKYMYILQISLGSKPRSASEVLRQGFCDGTNWRWSRRFCVINPSMDEALIPWEEMDDYQSKRRFANTSSLGRWAHDLQEPHCTLAITSYELFFLFAAIVFFLSFF